MTDQPIVVRGTPTQSQINAAVRQTIIAAGAIAGTLGYSHVAGRMDAALAMAGPIASLIAFLWGQWETRKTAKQAATMAQVVPDEVAVIKT